MTSPKFINSSLEVSTYIQFHWQFLIINSGFCFVNILMRKFATSWKKEMKMIKTQVLNDEQQKMSKYFKCHMFVICVWDKVQNT